MKANKSVTQKALKAKQEKVARIKALLAKCESFIEDHQAVVQKHLMWKDNLEQQLVAVKSGPSVAKAAPRESKQRAA